MDNNLNYHSDFSTQTAREIADPSTSRVEPYAVKGTVFVIPVDAPIPTELSSADIPSGTLYERLVHVCRDQGESFAFAPLSGAELNHLDRAWRLLQVAKRVCVLMELPGARYDVLFTQAARQIGLQRIDWPTIAEALAARAITEQRIGDATPWLQETRISESKRKMPKSVRIDDEALPEPSHEDQT